ncbi:unnamed protein product, partial [marine sediment metagenome]
TQLDLFGEAKVEVGQPEPMTEVKLGHRSVRIPLRKKRREALNKLMEILKELEGKDIYIGSYDAGGHHYWIDNLLLRRLQLEYSPFRFKDAIDYIPRVVVLWGSRGGCVRIFTDYLVAVREQEYQGYWLWLLDFRNGFWESPLDNFKSHYACLHITRFKE